jgi:cobalt-zinc-cadmium efflux system outer membrane protein
MNLKHAVFGWLFASLALALWPAGAEETAPPLAAFVREVVRRHPGVQTAEAALEAASAKARGQARYLYNPELELDYEEAETTTKQIGLAQTLDISGKRGVRSDVASAEVRAAMAARDAVRLDLVTELLTSLAGYQTQRQILAIGKRRFDLGQDFVVLAERRYAAGDAPRPDVLTARLAMTEVIAEKNEAEASLAKAAEKLETAAGGKSADWPILPEAPLDPPTLDFARIEHLPQIQLARADREAAQARIAVAKRNRIPDPTLGLRYGQENEDTLLGVRLAVPVPILNTFSAEVDAAQAESNAAEQALEAQRQKAKASLAASHKKYLAAIAAWQEWQKSNGEPLEEQRQLLGRLWEAGEINAVDYLVLLNQTFAAEKLSIELRTRLWEAWLDWLNASALTPYGLEISP